VTAGWPFPGDSSVVRARKIALAYRQAAAEQMARANRMRAVLTAAKLRSLRAIDPDLAKQITELIKEKPADVVHEMDERFLKWGEKWHTPLRRTSYDPDEMLGAEEAAQLLSVQAATLLTMRRRGRIRGVYVRSQNPHFEFKVADLYKLQSEMRGRNGGKSETTDNMADEKSSASP